MQVSPLRPFMLSLALSLYLSFFYHALLISLYLSLSFPSVFDTLHFLSLSWTPYTSVYLQNRQHLRWRDRRLFSLNSTMCPNFFIPPEALYH